STTGYYVIAPVENTKYEVGMPYTDASGNLQLIASSTMDLSQGGLMDNEGNLILGADVTDIVGGKVILPNGGTVVTGEATYTFDGSTVVGETELSTEGSIVISNNTTDGTSVSSTITAEIKTPNGKESTITLNGDGGDIEVPSGSTVVNNDGSETYLTGGGMVNDEGTITSSEITITVPADKVNNITIDGNNVTMPAGSIINEGTTNITYPGDIIYNTENNTIKYLPVDNLLIEDGTNIQEGITQEDINEAQNIVNQLPDGELKTQLQDKIDSAQDILNAKEAVEDLFDGNGNIKDTVTQEDINNAQDLVNQLPNGALKEELQALINEAQKQLNIKTGLQTGIIVPNTNKTITNNTISTSDTTNILAYITLLLASVIITYSIKRKKQL
ncbi:MAG: toxin Cry1Ac domain D-VI-related protein, partial [Coprobacillaceae bacterium]